VKSKVDPVGKGQSRVTLPCLHHASSTRREGESPSIRAENVWGGGGGSVSNSQEPTSKSVDAISGEPIKHVKRLRGEGARSLNTEPLHPAGVMITTRFTLEEGIKNAIISTIAESDKKI